MRRIPRKTGLAMAGTLIAILFALAACTTANEGQLRDTIASQQTALESANSQTTQAEACYAQLAGWTSDQEQLDVPDSCFGAGDAGRIASKMVSIAAGLRDEIWRLENELQAAVGRIDLEKQRADDTEARMAEDAEKTSDLRASLAQAQQDLIQHQLESAERINEGAKTIVDSTVNMTTTRSEISEESGATWLARFDSLEDAHDNLMDQRVQLADERALLDATVAEYVERNTRVERERLAEEQEKAKESVKAAERRAAAAEAEREQALIDSLEAVKEAEKTMATYQARLQELSKNESAFDSKKASNDAECQEAWSSIDASINHLLQQTSLLPPAQDADEQSSRVAEVQYRMNVVRGLWSEFSNVCRVSK